MRRLTIALVGLFLALPGTVSAQDALSDLRASAVGRPLAAALEACGVQVVRHAMPKGIGGLWLEARHTIILAQNLDVLESRLILAHEATHASRSCAGLTPQPPSEPEARPAWIESMLDEEAQALLAEAETAAELTADNADEARATAARRPLVGPLLSMLEHGASRQTVWAAARHAVGEANYRQYYEAMFTLSAAR